MPATSRTGYSSRRGPIIRDQRRIRTAHPTRLEDAIAMAQRNGFIVIPPTAPTANGLEIEDEPTLDQSQDDFQTPNEPSQHKEINLPPELVTRYAERREKLRTAWKSIEKAMTAAYFLCQYQTQNWTTYMTYLDPLEECVCPSTQKRKVDLIHTHDRFPGRDVEFCNCIPDAIRLIYLGYMSASPSKPRTAFSIPFIQLYKSVWLESAIPYSSFIAGITRHQDSRSQAPMMACSKHKNARELRIPFSQAMDAYSRLQTLQNDLVTVALGHTPQDKWASQCPCCFGPDMPDEVNPNGAAHAIIAMDGNFQHRHHHFASNDVPTNSDYPPNFINPSQIKGHEEKCHQTNEEALGINTSCSDAHKAANDIRNSSSCDKFDDTGLLYYPVSILNNILTTFPNKTFGLLYNIGCHLDAHVRKRDLLGTNLNRVLFGTSVFHAYVHNWGCQIQYNPRYNSNWGLSDGEGMERLWSQLSDLVGPLRSATRVHRLHAIAERCDYYADTLKKQSAKWLHNRLKKSQNVIQECTEKLEGIYTRFNHFTDETYTPHFFEAQWENERQYHTSRDNNRDDQKLELGRLLTLEEDLINAWQEIPASSGDILIRLRSIREIGDLIEAQRRRIGNQPILAEVTRDTESLFLKVWWAKTELRRKYLALLEEKRPLDAVRMGLASRLGTNGKERLIIALRKRSAALHTAVNTYNRHLTAFAAAYPDGLHPMPVEYNNLLQMESGDPFWSDGVFTNHEQPWASDPITQDGMRVHARLNRAEEEVQRIALEVRKLIRWAITSHKRLVPLMLGLSVGMDWAMTRLDPALNHPVLQSLSSEDQIDCIKAILHNQFACLAYLQLQWNTDIVIILDNTGPYASDSELKREWDEQILRLIFLKQQGYLSMIAGDFDNAFGDTLEGIDALEMHAFVNRSQQQTATPTEIEGAESDAESDEDDDIYLEQTLQVEELNNAYADGVQVQ
ncbi:hypothetical protein PCASD_00398 [Puccinia coronata f. sp. avenae]|uniref:CxC1-like cysteine cluster associated with KDZ transposases domain-containing protein n=1 Tax=Puccinia coronata f. sp. avenae TaxID=200324 RepID=A0A2N5VNJ6_9BASI|nr:hypothetical protein PCASD_00398 [Puccinia coronata f. sp. avenae]